MGVAEARYRAIGVVVACYPIPAWEAVVWAQLHHPEGDGSARIDIAHPVSADKWIDELGEGILVVGLSITTATDTIEEG